MKEAESEQPEDDASHSPTSAKATRPLPGAGAPFTGSPPPDEESEPPAKRTRVEEAGGSKEVTIGGPERNHAFSI